MSKTDIIDVLREAARRVYVHIPIAGGEMLTDTLFGFKTLAETAAEKSLVLWINEYFGPVERDGKRFDRMQVYLDNRDKVVTSIGIRQRSPDTFGENLRRMRERKLTFDEAIRTARVYKELNADQEGAGRSWKMQSCGSRIRRHRTGSQRCR